MRVSAVAARFAFAAALAMGFPAISAGQALPPPRLNGGIGEPISARGVSAPARAIRPAAPTQVYDHGDPTPQEQLMLELVNRARRDPPAEAARFGIDLNENLAPGTITPDPKPPLAFNHFLIASARNHSDWMLANDIFSHTGETNSTPGDRMANAGYPFTGSWSWGENIAWKGTTGAADLTQFTVDEHEGLIRSAGHRENIMEPGFDEIGIGVRTGQFTQQGIAYNSVMTTQNFASSDGTPGPLALGVVYRDTNGDLFYSVGEGLAGVTVTPSSGTYYAVTSASGGFAFPVSKNAGAITVTITGPGLAAPLTKTVTVGSINVKVDFDVVHEVPLRFAAGAGFDAQKHFQFSLTGPTGAKALVEFSLDFQSWQTLGTYPLTGGQAAVVDGSLSAARRYYRASIVP